MESIISTIEKLQSEPIEIPDNFEVIKVSTSKTTGQQWVQYAPKEKVFNFDYDKVLSKHIKNVKRVDVEKV